MDNEKFIYNHLKANNYKFNEYENGYGAAVKGMDSLSWNEDGNHIKIMKDNYTRVVFSGQVNTLSDLELIMSLVR